MAITSNNSLVSATNKPKVSTYTKKIILPEKKEMTYSEAGIPEEQNTQEPTIAMKQVFTSTPTQRQKYTRDVEEQNQKIIDYNNKIKEAKKSVDAYNEKVRIYNRNRVVTQTYTTTSTPKTVTTTVSSDKGKTSPITPLGQSFIDSFNTSKDKNNIAFNYDYRNVNKIIAEEKEIQKKESFSGQLKSQVLEKPYVTIPSTFVSGLKQIRLTPSSEPSLAMEGFIGAKQKVTGFFTETKPAKPTGAKELLDRLRNQPKPNENSFLLVQADVKQGLSNLKNPRVQAQAVLLGGELAVGYGISKAPQIVTTIKYKTAGTYVNPRTFYSKQALTQEKGLSLGYTPSKTIKAFERTKGKTLELPNQYVGVSQTTSTIGNKVLTKTALGQKLTEDPGLFISPKGTGQTRFLRVQGETAPTSLSINPFESWTQGQPKTYVVGFKNLGRYPSKVITSKGYQSAEAYQLTQSAKSKAIITKMSELGKGEPEAVVPVGSRLQQVKTPLYYTEYKGRVIPIKTVTVLGEGQTARNLISTKSVIKNVKSYESLLSGGSSKFSISPSILFPSSSKASSQSSYVISYSPVTSPSRTIPRPSPIIPTSEPSTTTTSSTTYTSTTTSRVAYPESPTYINRPFSYIPSYPTLPTTTRTPTRTGVILIKPKEPKGAITTQAYDTYVLDKKSWVKVNKGNERNNYYGALQLGSEVADNSSARSFKLKRASGTANRIYPYQPSLIKFYQPSKQGNPKLTTAYIEKTKYLIDTQGERQDISAKGYMKQRKFRGF